MIITQHQKNFIFIFSLGFATATLIMTGVMYLRSEDSSESVAAKVKRGNGPIVIVSKIGEGVTAGTPEVMEDHLADQMAETPVAAPMKPVASVAPKMEAKKLTPLTDGRGFQISRMGFSFRKSDWKTYQQDKKTQSADEDWIDETAVPPLKKNKLVKFQIQAYRESGKIQGRSKKTKKNYKLAVKRLPATIAHALSLVKPKESILVKLSTPDKDPNFKWPTAHRKDTIYEIKRY